MKKALVAVSVLGILALLATTANAVPLYPRSPEDWNVASGGAGIGPNEAAPAGWGPILNNAPVVGDEDRTLFNVEGLTDGTNGNTMSFNSVSGPTYGSLTGLAYDLQIVNTAVVSVPTLNNGDPTLLVYLGNSTRNTIPGGQPAGTGGAFVVYDNADNGSTTAGSKNELFNPGSTGTAPGQWVPGTAGGFDTYPGAGSNANSSVFLYGTFQNVAGQSYVGVEVLDLVSGSGYIGTSEFSGPTGLTLVMEGGNANALAVFGGVGNTLNFAPELYFPTAGEYEGSSADAGSWQVESDDSFSFIAGTGSVTVGDQTFTTTAGDSIQGSTQDASSLYGPIPVPEPATLTLLGLGLSGLFLRKRKK